MATVQTKSGDLPLSIGGTADVYGDTAAQLITIQDNSNITFQSGFNSGARDTITLTGAAENFLFSVVNGKVVLTSQIDHISITLPVGSNGTNITFDNGDTRLLSVSGSGAGTTYSLGAQTFVPANSPPPVVVTPGPTGYEVTATAVQQLEGTAYVFNVHRTGTLSAETLTFNVQGDTVGGSVAAATPGLDFTAAGNTIQFALNQTDKTFTVNLNLDNDVEGLEGILAQVFKSGIVVGSTTGLIEDANKIGQTFILTPAIDTVGSGAQTDVVGSEGSISVVGNDTIKVTENTATTFDNIDGGGGRDLLDIKDAGSGGFGGAPDFTNITVKNVEEVDYTSVRGLDSGKLDTSGWTGLDTFMAKVDSGADQTFTFASAIPQMSISLTNADDGDMNVVGGTGTLSVTAQTPGDINIGQTAIANGFVTVFTLGGDDVRITDRSAGGTLTNAQLSGFGDDATLLSGAAILNVGISDLTGGNSRVVNITAANAVVTLSDVDVGDMDITASNNVTVNGDGNTVGGNGASLFGNLAVGDINSTNGNIVVNSTGGYLYFGDVNANGAAASTVTLNDTDGGIVVDDVTGPNLTTVNLTGNSGIYIDQIDGTNSPGTQLSINVKDSVSAYIYGTIFEPGGSPNPGVVITATNSGGVQIYTQVGNNTQFNGAGDTGSDSVIFGATGRANSFGGGDDYVTFNAPAVSAGGSFNFGLGYDRFYMESNNAAKYSAAATGNSGLEELNITSQTLGTQDTINLANLGFTAGAFTNVVSAVGPAANVAEVQSITFGVPNATWTDSVTFSGALAGLPTMNLTDNENPAAIATQFANLVTANPGAGWNVQSVSGATVTLVDNTPGNQTNITASSFTFNDATTVGSPGLEAGSPSYSPIVGGDNTGVTPVAATTDQLKLHFDSVSVLTGQTMTFDPQPAGAPTYTFTATQDLTQAGDALQDALVAWNGIAGYNITKDANHDLLITATSSGDRPVLGITGDGLTPPSDQFTYTYVTDGSNAVAADFEEFTFLFDGTTTGNDQVTFDGVTVTFANGLTVGQMTTAFISQYNDTVNVSPGVTRHWVASNLLGSVHMTATVAEPRTDVTSTDFVFTDDTNIGTPTVTVPAATTEGSTSGIILNNFITGSTLTLTGLGATHTVNLGAGLDTNNDTLNLNLWANGNHGTVLAPLFENVIINTDSDGTPATDSLTLTDAAAKVLTITGSDALTLDTNSTLLTTVNAGGLSGKFTWDLDANTVPVLITTGSGGSKVSLAAMTVPGLAPITFTGGSGNDEVTLGAIGHSRANITLGGGNDLVHVGAADGGNDYSSIGVVGNLFTAAAGSSQDKLDFDGLGTNADSLAFVAVRDQQLEPTAVFQDYLDQAAVGNATGSIHWFLYNGDTYVVRDNGASATFQDGTDQLIRLAGDIALTSANFA